MNVPDSNNDLIFENTLSRDWLLPLGVRSFRIFCAYRFRSTIVSVKTIASLRPITSKILLMINLYMSIMYICSCQSLSFCLYPNDTGKDPPLAVFRLRLSSTLLYVKP